MFPNTAPITRSLSLLLGVAIAWALVACAVLCAAEEGAHLSETVPGIECPGFSAAEDCFCAAGDAPAAALQRRAAMNLPEVSRPFSADPPTAAVFSFFSELRAAVPDGAPPNINAPPLYLSHRTIRV